MEVEPLHIVNVEALCIVLINPGENCTDEVLQTTVDVCVSLFILSNDFLYAYAVNKRTNHYISV